MMLKNINIYIYTIWKIIYFSSIISIVFTLTIGYKFYFDNKYSKLLFISSFNSFISIVLFICINNLSNYIKQYEYNNNNETSDNETSDNETSDNETLNNEILDEEITDEDILNEEEEDNKNEIINILHLKGNDRWLFYKKICFYELIKIKNEILLNPLNENFYFKFLKNELNKITIKNKDISNYKNEIHMIIYYLTTEKDLKFVYLPLIKPLKAIYKLC